MSASPKPSAGDASGKPGADRGRLVIVLGVVLALQLLFVVSYVKGLARPSPDHIPVAVVGTSQPSLRAMPALQKLVGSTLEVRRVATLAQARELIDDQQIFAAIVPRSKSAKLYVASASGASIARLFERVAPLVAARTGVPIRVGDLKPLPGSDPNGLVGFYVTLGCVIYGYIAAILLFTALPAVRPLVRLSALALFSVVSGLCIALLVGEIVDGYKASFAALAGISMLAAFAGASLTSLFLFGGRELAFLVSIIVLVILGSPSAGGAIATDLLPPFHRFVGQWLPTGAGTSAQRDAAYFSGHEHVQPLLVLAAWVLVTVALQVILELSPRLRRTRLDRQPNLSAHAG